MSEEYRRSQLTGELRQVLGDLARLSETIAVLRRSQSSADPNLREVEVRWAATNSRANTLRREVALLDDAQKTPVPR